MEKETKLLKKINFLEKIILRLKEKNDRLRKLATRDPLTGFHNKHYLMDELDRLIDLKKRKTEKGDRRKEYLSLVFVDMDNLKVINDKHGHNIGDQAIMLLAKKLAEVTRKSDIVARIQGDEFVIAIISGNENEGRGLYERIKEGADKIPFTVSNKKISVAASAGFSSGLLAEVNLKKIIKKADTDMYRQKKIRKKKIA